MTELTLERFMWASPLGELSQNEEKRQTDTLLPEAALQGHMPDCLNMEFGFFFFLVVRIFSINFLVFKQYVSETDGNQEVPEGLGWRLL